MTGQTRAETATAAAPTETPLDLSDRDGRDDAMREAIDGYVDDLIAATEDARESEAFREFLDAQSRFHSYSFRNTLLIKMQRPDATCVAGYRTWQDEFDRHVMKGESAIHIMRPIITERCPECGNAPSYHDDIGCDYDETPPSEWGEGIVGYTSCSVFDVSQTEGEPLPSLPTDAAAGADIDAETVRDALLDAGDSLAGGVSVVPAAEWQHGEADGVCRLDGGDVEVVDGRPAAATLGTLAHEYAHALLHADDADDADGDGVFGTVHEATTAAHEVEAEAVAYIVGRHFGLDMDGSGFYIAAWADEDRAGVRDRLKRISKAARRIIDAAS